MDYGPLVTEEIAAGAELIRGFHRYAAVEAAFWLRASDEDQRYLYLASDQMPDGDVRKAYGEVLRLVLKMQSPYLDPMRVKLISGKTALALAAAEMTRKYFDQSGVRLASRMLGDQFIDDAYIYPTLAPVAAL